MKTNFRNHSIINQRQAVTAFVLSGILSLSSTALLNSAIAAPVNSASPVTKELKSINRNLPRAVRNAVIRDLSRRQGIAPSNISIVEYTERTWRNGCLELAGPGELCTQALVPGWQVVVSNGRENLIYHTNNNGRNLRVTNRNISDNSDNTSLPSRVRDAVIRAASSHLRVQPRQLNITQATQRDWRNGCLELAEPGQVCTQQVISGWRVVVGIKDTNLIYHTNESGSVVRLNRKESDIDDNKGLSDKAERAVLRAAAGASGLPVSELEIGSVQQINVDGCLGLARPNEACTKINQPAFRVTVEAGKRRLVYHVLPDGSQVRLNLAASNITDQVGSNVNIPINIADAVLRDASKWSGRSEDTFRITKAQKVTFSNPCSLTFNRICDMSYIATPGWKVTVDSGLGDWTYLVSADGKIVNQDQTPALAPRLAEVIKKDALRRSSEKDLAELRITSIKSLSDNHSDRNFSAEVTVSNGMENWVYAVDKDTTRYEYLAVASIPKPIVNSVLADAQKRAVAKINVSTKNITGAEQVTWRNGNLGDYGNSNTQTPVRGWRITVEVGRERFVYHTNNFVGNASNKIAFRLDTDASKIIDNVAGVPIPKRELPPALTDGVIFRYVTTGGIIGRTYETVLLEDGRLIQTRVGDMNDSDRRVFRLEQSETKEFQQLLKRQAGLFNNSTYPAPSGAADYITYTVTSEKGTVQYNDISREQLPENLKVVLKAWNDLTATKLSNR